MGCGIEAQRGEARHNDKDKAAAADNENDNDNGRRQ